MGTGIIVSGLASIVIGEILFKKLTTLKLTTVAILGSLVYRAILSTALKMGLNASDLKLITALMMVLILSGVMEKGLTKFSLINSKRNSENKSENDIGLQDIKKDVNAHA